MASPQLRLVPLTAEDFPLLREWFPSEAAMVQWGGTAVRFPLDDAQLRAMLAEGDVTPPRRLCWMVQRGSEVVGHVQLAFDWHHGNAVVSRVAIAPDQRGRGLARPMIEAVGFVREGGRRASTRVGQERWDSIMMGLLRDEWEATR